MADDRYLYTIVGNTTPGISLLKASSHRAVDAYWPGPSESPSMGGVNEGSVERINYKQQYFSMLTNESETFRIILTALFFSFFSFYNQSLPRRS